MKLSRWTILSITILTGCQTQTTKKYLPTVDLPQTLWTVGTPSDQAVAMTPDQAKAVLVARAYIEEQARKQAAIDEQPAGQPQFLKFQPMQTAAGWDVYVDLVGNWIDERPTSSPGHSTIVSIDHKWKVTDYHVTDSPPTEGQPATSQPGN